METTGHSTLQTTSTSGCMITGERTSHSTTDTGIATLALESRNVGSGYTWTLTSNNRGYWRRITLTHLGTPAVVTPRLRSPTYLERLLFLHWLRIFYGVYGA